MSEPIARMARLCGIFTVAYAIASVAYLAADLSLEALTGVVLPSGAALGVQIAVAWYAGHRYGQETPGLPGSGWWWRAGFYTALLAIAVSLVIGIVALALLASPEEREALGGLFSPEIGETYGAALSPLVIGIIVVVVVLWIGLSTLAHRFIMAHAARKSFDPAEAF